MTTNLKLKLPKFYVPVCRKCDDRRTHKGFFSLSLLITRAR